MRPFRYLPLGSREPQAGQDAGGVRTDSASSATGTRRGIRRERRARFGRPEQEGSMSHRGVEIVLGRLATDEALRGRFAAQGRRMLEELIEQGLELSAVERAALEALDRKALERFAAALDPRLQKAAMTARPADQGEEGGAE
jgi:hypothetical protein